MSMERVSPPTPPPLRDRVAFELWRRAHAVTGRAWGLAFERLGRGSLAERVLFRIYRGASNAYARASNRTSVCSCCMRVACPSTCVQAVAAARRAGWRRIELGRPAGGYASAEPMTWSRCLGRCLHEAGAAQLVISQNPHRVVAS